MKTQNHTFLPQLSRPFISLLLLSLLLTACAMPTAGPTPTPTRTPKPTLTPTPVPTPTLVPTPTPAFPVTVSCGGIVPAAACAHLQESVTQDPQHFSWVQDPALADIQLGDNNLPNAVPVGTWTYVVAAPFFTVENEVSAGDLIATWTGVPTGPFIEWPLLVTTDVLKGMSSWGPPTGEQLQVVAATELLPVAEQTGGWAILPFDELTPAWKVLRLDGISVLEKGLDLETYPLTRSLYLGSSSRPETLALFNFSPDDFSNRHEEGMTIVAMTGVTAMTRAFAAWMERKGNTYAGEDIRELLVSADFTHISNEVSFRTGCQPQPSGTMSFCSSDDYIELLEFVGADIIELTGNHLADKGLEPLSHTLDMYRERGWQWYGGGEDLADATRPLTVTQGPNRLAFIGCNPIGPAYDWATEDSPGSAPCDYEKMQNQVRELRDAGYLPIVTLQYLETEQYYPTAQQVRDFRSFAEAGAVVMQGSQAHQVQTMEFYGDTFIHYGLGNLFFDQNWPEARPDFIDRLVFYDGRLLSVDLRPTILGDYGRRRPMTPEEERPFLEMIFSLSPRGQ